MVSESPTCWGHGATNANKLGTPVCYPRQLPKTQKEKGNWYEHAEQRYLVSPWPFDRPFDKLRGDLRT
jgi:hypothetical protein